MNVINNIISDTSLIFLFSSQRYVQDAVFMTEHTISLILDNQGTFHGHEQNVGKCH